MKLWILEPIKGWMPWYDKAFGFVIRATSEQEARRIAALNSGDEGEQVWLDAKKTSCNTLSKQGESEMILRDFASA